MVENQESGSTSRPSKFEHLKRELIESPTQRVVWMVGILLAGFLLIFLVNNVISHINTTTWAYENQRIFPTYPPAGNDFRVGYYWPPMYLLITKFAAIGPNGSYPSNYPPLVAFTSLPYMLFNDKTAYLVHVGLIVLANLASLGIAVSLVKDHVLSKLNLSKPIAALVSLFLFFVVSIYIFSSYFYAYSMERGNTDIFAIFYCLLAVWVLVKLPNKIWLQVILLSVAVHFKIYPVVLFALLLFKHGRKLILPTLVVNLAFLFILGPKIAWGFIQSVTSGGEGAGIGNAWSNIGNHASYSFTMGIDPTGGDYLTTTFFVIWGISFMVPLVIWAISVLAMVQARYSEESAIWFFMITVPIMSLLPTVSMDYKLVILGCSIVFLLALVLKQFIHKFSWFDLFQLVLLTGALLMLSRSYALIDKSLVFIRNKYIWVLILEAAMAVNILRYLGPTLKNAPRLRLQLFKTAKPSLTPPNTNG